MEIASLRAEIRKMSEAYAKRPRELTLTARTKRAVEAGYLAQWVQRIACIKRAAEVVPLRVIDIDTETGVVKLETADGTTRTAITATKGPVALAVV